MRTIRAEQVKNLFAGNIRKLLLEAPRDYERIYEIRLRVGRPVFLCYDGGEKFLRTKDVPYLVTRQDLKETLGISADILCMRVKMNCGRVISVYRADTV